jgi:hypothetical protein
MSNARMLIEDQRCVCDALNGEADVNAMRGILLVLERPDITVATARTRCAADVVESAISYSYAAD